MCFSAEASFSASAVIFAAGAISTSKVKKVSQLPFAAIPLIFSAQQAIEGVLWLALSNAEYAAWRNTATYLFLFFAQVVWPLWVPLAILLLEKDPLRIRILRIFLGMGALLSVYFGYRLVFHGVQARIISHHIVYDIDFPYHWVILSGTMYVIATLVPAFISRIKKMAVFGVAMTLSFLISIFFYFQFITSVWCFFAALVSVIIYFIVRELPEPAADSHV